MPSAEELAVRRLEKKMDETKEAFFALQKSLIKITAQLKTLENFIFLDHEGLFKMYDKFRSDEEA